MVMSVAAEPASGSEMATAIVDAPSMTGGRNCAFWSAVPNRSMTRVGPVFASNTWNAAIWFSLASSSITSSESMRSAPPPPYSSGRPMPRKPSSASRVLSSSGRKVRFSSHDAMCGA